MKILPFENLLNYSPVYSSTPVEEKYDLGDMFHAFASTGWIVEEVIIHVGDRFYCTYVLNCYVNTVNFDTI